ncbi:AAA family ATPase [Dyella sp. KRB-257]|uniref:AAA family ATPase n=1 Tax=Dyella sp. KRB-257 TaxID=3400915 RepID=UPI003C0FDD75
MNAPERYIDSFDDWADCEAQRHPIIEVPTGPRVELIGADQLKPEAIRWLWPGWLARGKLHVLAGAPGTGKTTLAMAVAAAVSASTALPSGWKPRCGSVLIWSGEDDPRDTLVPRLIAAGADRSRIHFVRDTIDEGDYRRPFDPSRDVAMLAIAAKGIKDIALIVVDPLVSAVGGDSHKNAEVRRGLAPLVDLAARLDAALLGITHYSKGTGGREPLERVSGSLAFGALARVVMGTVRQKEGEDSTQNMVLARAKSNIGPDGGGYAYAFEQTELPGYDGLIASRIVWGCELQGTARELLAEPEAPREDRAAPARDGAAEFLMELLQPGPVATEEIKAEARDAGFTWATVRRAKEEIGAKSRKNGFEDSRWFWALPDPKPVEGAHQGAHAPPNKKQVSTFASDEHLRSTVRVPEGVEDAQFSEGAEGAHRQSDVNLRAPSAHRDPGGGRLVL